MIMISNFLFNFINFYVTVTFFTKLLTLGILFLTALRAFLVAKWVILVISSLISFTLALRVVLVAQLVMSGILCSIFLILALHTSFLMTSLFTTSLSLHKSTGTATNSTTSNLSTLLFLTYWNIFQFINT